MIVRKQELKLDVKSGLRGGTGEVEMLQLEEPDRLSHGRLFSQLTMPPGASIGSHPHEGETEYYYILQGEGVVEEADGKKPVGPGDVVVTGGGASHSIENTGSTPLVFVALILFDE